LFATHPRGQGQCNALSSRFLQICKYFLDAVEKSLYGWFWECPNGGEKCMYRHALPPGYVLKRDQKKADEGPVITLEELIEEEVSVPPRDALSIADCICHRVQIYQLLAINRS
jgi:hypothetical protein